MTPLPFSLEGILIFPEDRIRRDVNLNSCTSCEKVTAV